MKRLGLIGLGEQGLRYVHFLRGRDASVVALCGRATTFPAKFRHAGQVFGVSEEHHYRTVEAMINKEQLDAVIVAMPPEGRLTILLELASARLPIFCENPFVLSIGGAGHCIGRLKSNRVVCTVNEQWPLLPSVQWMMKQIQDGAIGKVRCIMLGGKGRPWTVELPRIGLHLLAVALKITREATIAHVTVRKRDMAAFNDLLGVIFTASGIPINLDFSGPYDVRKAFIEVIGSQGRIKLVGSMLENIWWHRQPFDVSGQSLNAWDNVCMSWLWNIGTPDQENVALVDRAMNPTFQLLQGFLQAIDGRGDNPFPPEDYLPVLKAYDLLTSK